MNVMFLYSSMKKGGAERVIASLANRFATLGDTVSIAVLSDSASSYELDPRVELLCFGIARDSTSAAQASGNQLRKIKTIRNAVKEKKPDVIVAFDPQLAVLAKIACPSVKVVGSERSNPFLARVGFRKKLFVKLSGMVDGFVFQTNGAKSFYPKSIQKKSTVIPNGVFCNLPEVTTGFLARRKSICATGSLRQVKRYDLLVDAFSKFSEKNSEYTLHIYGDGKLRSALEEQVKRLGLETRVVLEGNRADIASELVTHRIFVLSSDHEGMPNGLIEAMACGCACVSTDCNFGPSELICEGENGMLVPVGDAEKMAEAMLRIAEDEAFGEMLAQKACEIQKTHAPEEIADRFRNYFASMKKS